ncbi:MAG TPA: hypothetical protein VE987_13135, partial [Polyangiaceae bacterium]|nr:hypothetical protein [Polyangiaceae bacterium]
MTATNTGAAPRQLAATSARAVPRSAATGTEATAAPGAAGVLESRAMRWADPEASAGAYGSRSEQSSPTLRVRCSRRGSRHRATVAARPSG